MKKGILILILLGSSVSFGQVLGGPIVEDGRKMITESNFTIESYKHGTIDCELAVNIEGNVESVRILKSDVKSTPLEMKVKNHLKKYKFQPGTYYPKYHHIRIRMNIVPAEEN